MIYLAIYLHHILWCIDRYDMIKDAVMGSGTFYVTFQLLNGMSPLPQNYSLSPEEDVVVEVSVDSTVAQIKVVINKCWATQSSNPLEPTTYVFLENRSVLRLLLKVPYYS